MSRFNITTKIWLSIGVFVIGYIISISLGQVQGVSAERVLRNTTQNLFPAAQQGQEAAAGFDRSFKAFSDAVLMQDQSTVERANQEGVRVVELLTKISSISGLPVHETTEARRLASLVRQLVSDARSTYGAFLANPATMDASAQATMHDLATRTEAAKTALQSFEAQLAGELKAQLSALEVASARQRLAALLLFAATLAVAAVIVSWTIRKSITGPIVRVIDGVETAANEATHASERMSHSGQVVARDAEKQAVLVEETSASLQEISATTQENAARAAEADQLMCQARETVEGASKAMADLTRSMASISESSRQVATVLKSIDEIAFHTNILALNAAVEAARAGDTGAGFSVVAEEVRSLAHRAAEAARGSGEIIDRTIADVNAGVRLVNAAREAFTEVSGKIATGSRVVTQIAASSQHQASGVAQIGEAVARIHTVTQNNADNAKETVTAVHDMTTQLQATRQHLDELVAVVGVSKR